MTKEQINARIEELENNMFLESMKDLGYDFDKVREWRKEVQTLKQTLKSLEG